MIKPRAGWVTKGGNLTRVNWVIGLYLFMTQLVVWFADNNLSSITMLTDFPTLYLCGV